MSVTQVPPIVVEDTTNLYPKNALDARLKLQFYGIILIVVVKEWHGDFK